MNKNTYFYDMLNQYSSDQNIEANNNNYEILNNLKYQSSQNLFSRLYGPSYNYSSISLNNLNYFSKTESDIGKEKIIKNDNNNTNNNYSANNNNNIGLNSNLCNGDNNLKNFKSLKNSQFNMPSNENNINKNLSYGDYFLNASINYEKNNLMQNKLNLNEINNNQILNNQLINNSKINNIDNKSFFNYNFNNNLNNDFMSYNPNISINNIIINNIAIKNQQNNCEKNNNKINDNLNLEANEKKNEDDKKKEDDKNMIKEKPKRRRRRRKKNNNINVIISYGHPKSIIYKIIKQKLNVHKKFDLECRSDSLLFIHSISKLKKIIKQLFLNNKIKEKKLLQELEKLYINSILSIPHKDYAQDITGFKLI